MESKGLSVGVLLKQAWGLYKQRWFFLSVTLLIAGVISFFSVPIEYALEKPSSVVVALLRIAQTLFSLAMFLGLLKIYVQLAKGEAATYLDLFRGFPMTLNLLVSQIILALLVFGAFFGLILIFVGPVFLYHYMIDKPLASFDDLSLVFLILTPAFICFLMGFTAFLVTRFMLMPFFIVDCYEGPVEALKMSNRAARGVTWDFFALLIVSFFLSIIGIAFLGIGYLVAFPVIYLSQALAYKELLETTEWN